MTESKGQISLIRQYIAIGGVAAFVSRLDLGKKARVEVKSLGNGALSLGRGTSLLLTLTTKG